MQYDLFDSIPPTLINIAPQTELPKVLTKPVHGVQGEATGSEELRLASKSASAQDLRRTPQPPQIDSSDAVATASVQLGAHFVTYQLQRSKRRSIGFLINENGLRITAPRWVNLAEINNAILSKQRWILTKLQEQRLATPLTPTVWTRGATLPFLGQAATLDLQYGVVSYFDSAAQLLILNLPPDAPSEQCKKQVQMWLMDQARRLFSERLAHFANQLGEQFHSFSLSSAKTLWGSCTVQRKIRLNWRLIHLAPHLIDYVVAHELAHLREMNHSPRFWATLGKIFPEYAAARAELKRVNMKTLSLF